MGNIQASDCASALGFSLPTSHDLERTSLQINHDRKQKHKAQTVNPKTPDAKLNREGDMIPIDSDRIILRRLKTCQPVLEREKSRSKLCVGENDFRILQVLDSGKYGKLCMVKKEQEKGNFTMKVICRKKIAGEGLTDSILIEKEILQTANHPFIPKLDCYFENDKKICLVMEHLDGGDLYNALKKLHRCSEEISRFYSTEALLALEYLHEHLRVSYNNLKLKHALLDSQGHLRLIDFTRSKKFVFCSKEVNSDSSIADTMPSINLERSQKNQMARLNDYRDLGCFIYEMLTGQSAFKGCDKEGNKSIISVNDLVWPQFVSKHARDLISRLMTAKPEERLGYNGIEEIKKHPFFNNINWEKVLTKHVYPPMKNNTQFSVADLDEEEEEQANNQADSQQASLTEIQDNACGKCTVTSLGDLLNKALKTIGKEPGLKTTSRCA